MYLEENFDLTGFHMVNLSTAAILHDVRVRQGLSQSQVAERAGITQPMYQRFESGKRNLMTCSFRVTCRVLEALNIDITKFYHGEYVIGGEIYIDPDGKLRYVESDKLVNGD